jgi:cytosine/adenosine deaminase-related metal-dependent hydrolase
VSGGDLPSTGRTLFEGALRGGSQSLGLKAEQAGLAVGAAADFFSLDAQQPALAERRGDSLLDSLVFAGARDAIDGVWRAGRKRVSRGRHELHDEAARTWRNSLSRLLRD